MALNRKAFNEWLESDGTVPFDLWAQDPGMFPLLSESYPGILVASAGGLVPFQAEGLLDGHPFYYRDEWGFASLKVGLPDGDRPYSYFDTFWAAQLETEAWQEGRDFEKNLLALLPLLSRSDYLYEFEALKVLWAPEAQWQWALNAQEREVVLSRGFTPEDAFAKLYEPSPYLAEKGFRPEEQVKLALAREINPAPLNRDERKFPEIDPPFLTAFRAV